MIWSFQFWEGMEKRSCVLNADSSNSIFRHNYGAGAPAFDSESFWAARWTCISRKSEGIKDLLDQQKQMALHYNDCPCMCLDGDDSNGTGSNQDFHCQTSRFHWESLDLKLNHYFLFGANNMEHQIDINCLQ